MSGILLQPRATLSTRAILERLVVRGARPMSPGAVARDIGGQPCQLFDLEFPDMDPSGATLTTILRDWAQNAKVKHSMAVAVISNAAAAAAAEHKSKHFHCADMGERLNRKRLLVRDDPSKKRLRTMVADLAAPVVPVLKERKWNGKHGARKPELILYWLAASQGLREQKDAVVTCRQFAKMLSLSPGFLWRACSRTWTLSRGSCSGSPGSGWTVPVCGFTVCGGRSNAKLVRSWVSTFSAIALHNGEVRSSSQPLWTSSPAGV